MSEVKSYTVVWITDVEAEDEVGAANIAREIMHSSNDPDFIANIFGVADFNGIEINDEKVSWIDLDKLEGRV